MAVLDYPELTAHAIPQYIGERPTSRSLEPVAVVACACRLPGVDDPDGLWNAIVRGESPIREVPDSWLDSRLYFDPKPGKPGKTYSKLAAIFDRDRVEKEIAQKTFPASFRCNDPLLKTAYIVATETLSQTFSDVEEKNVGIYLGGLRASDLSYDYSFSTTAEAVLESVVGLPEFAALDPSLRETVVRRSVEEIAKRYRRDDYWGKSSPGIKISDFVADLKRTFQWTGPAFSLDAACSSSLVAVDCACNDLREGRVRGALVGAISSMTQLSLILFSKNFAATTGKSRPFDKDADGVVSSMGLVFVFLKTLDRARQDGDTILGVIRNVGFSSDGRGKTLWAPRTEGQILAMRRAYDNIDATPDQLVYLEAHATSTGVGDSTELKTIDTLLDEYPRRPTVHASRKIAVGSVKSHFGHSFEAAGLVSLIKVLQMIRHRVIPRQINISNPHDELRDDKKRFFVPFDAERSLPFDAEPGLFGINAFGVGGINAHLVLEEFQDRNITEDIIASDIENASSRDFPVAVVGLGCVYPGAYSSHAFWDLLNSDEDPKRPLSSHGRKQRLFPEKSNEKLDAIPGGFIEDYVYDWGRHRIPPLQIERCDPLQTFVMGAVDEAVSGRNLSDEERDGAFVVVGTDHDTSFFHEFLTTVRGAEVADIVKNSLFCETKTGEKRDGDPFAVLASEFVKKIQKEHPCILDATGGFCSSSLASRITKLYDMHGGAFAIDGGHPSSLIALDYCIRKISRDTSSLGICGGAYRWTNPHAFEYHADHGPSATFPLAEGAGAVLLKALSQVDAKTEKPYAIIRVSIPVTDGRLDASFWESQDIDIENLAFVAISAPDISKHLPSLATSFQEADRKNRIPLVSSRAKLGNLCAGAGIAELIASSLMFDNRMIPAQHLPADTVDENGLFYVPTDSTPLDTEDRIFEQLFAVILDLDQFGNGFAVIVEPRPFGFHEEPSLDGLSLRPIRRAIPYSISDSLHGIRPPKVVRPVSRFRQFGSRYEMGFGLGVADSVGIGRLIEAYANHPERDALIGSDIEELLPHYEEVIGVEGTDELRGLADGSGVSFEDLFLHNILFYRNLKVRHVAMRHGAHLVDSTGVPVMPFQHVLAFECPLRKMFAQELDVQIREREPAGGWSHSLIGATGCIGGWAGYNAIGVAVSVTGIRVAQSNLFPHVTAGQLLERFDHLPGDDELKSFMPEPRFSGSVLVSALDRGEFILKDDMLRSVHEDAVSIWNGWAGSLRNGQTSADSLGFVWIDGNVGFRLFTETPRSENVS